MNSFEFHFQYNLDDHTAIRSFEGVAGRSPSNAISVGAVAFAACLLVLGGIGSWNLLTALVIGAVIFVSILLFLFSRYHQSTHDFTFRTIILSEDSLIEQFGNSQFVKSWSAFDEWQQTESHLFLRHYEKTTTIPKRVIDQDQLAGVVSLINDKIDQKNELALADFPTWFSSEQKFPVYQFHWSESGINGLRTARLEPFDAMTTTPVYSNFSLGRPIMFTFLIIALILITSLGATGTNGLIDILVFPFAVIFPFLIAFIWWKITSQHPQKSPRIPKETMFVTLDESELRIGYPKAVAKYSWDDIGAFYHCERYIGFRPITGMIHVISNEAFGGYRGALEFLTLADSLSNQTKAAKASVVEQPETGESGNPFQSPGYFG